MLRSKLYRQKYVYIHTYNARFANRDTVAEIVGYPNLSIKHKSISICSNLFHSSLKHVDEK